MGGPRRPLGLVALTALVVGNMVGSGVFSLPAALAPYRGGALVGWGVSALGSMLLGLVLGRLARRSPAAGGPYAFTRAAFGDFAGFLVGWGYWVSCWVALATIAVAMVGYLAHLAPDLADRRGLAAAAATLAIAALTVVNAAGVRSASGVQVVTTALKVLPLLGIAVFGLLRFDAGHCLVPFVPEGESLFSASTSCLTLTLWSFLGLEAATIPAGEVADARRTIPRATVLGVAVVACLYVASSLAVMGLVPRATLMGSSAPYAEAARVLWGEAGGTIVAVGAAVACFGALNGWILCTGQFSLAVARDGMFPGVFARTTRGGTPVAGLVIACVLAIALVAANASSSLVEMFTWMSLLSTLSAVVPLVLCTMAELELTLRARRSGSQERITGPIVLTSLAFAYTLCAVWAAGKEAVTWGFLGLLAGLPLFVLLRARTDGSARTE